MYLEGLIIGLYSHGGYLHFLKVYVFEGRLILNPLYQKYIGNIIFK